MVVQDQLYGCLRRVGSVEKFEKFDELSTSVAILNKRVNLALYEVNAGQQTDRAMALILVLTCKGRIYQVLAAGLERLLQWLESQASHRRRRWPPSSSLNAA